MHVACRWSSLLALLVLGGCLDDSGGPRDQWYGTDAYLAPEATAPADAGDGPDASCGDGPSFAAPVRVSGDEATDAGQAHANYDVVMAASGGARVAGWTDRNLATQGPTLRVATLAVDGAPQASTAVETPATCAALVRPALAMTAAGILVLAAVCAAGSEQAPTATDIVVMRAPAGGAAPAFGAAVTAVPCPDDSRRCASPALAADAGGALYLAWADGTVSAGQVTSRRISLARSDDDGLTFGSAAVVADTYVLADSPRLAVAPDGVLHIAYSGVLAEGGPSYASHAQRDAAGQLTSGELLGRGTEPSVAADSAGVLVAWAADGYVQEAHAVGGSAFSFPLPVDSRAAAAIVGPAAASAGDGRVHLFWLAQRAGLWGAEYSVSADSGASWHAPLELSEPFDGDPTGATNPAHALGRADLVAVDTVVLAGWAEPASTDPETGLSRVYAAARRCE